MIFTSKYNLKFFESGRTKWTKKELIKDIIAKKFQVKVKAELVRNNGQKCWDLDDIIEVIQDCKRYVKLRLKSMLQKTKLKRSGSNIMTRRGLS